MCSELRLVSWWAHSLLRISLAMEKIWNRLVVLNTWSLGACLSRFSSSPGQTALFCCSLVAYHKPTSITGSSDACVYVQIQWILEFCYCLKPRGTKITSVAHPETSLWYWNQAVPCRWFGSVSSYAWWWEWLSCCLFWDQSRGRRHLDKPGFSSLSPVYWQVSFLTGKLLLKITFFFSVQLVLIILNGTLLVS